MKLLLKRVCVVLPNLLVNKTDTFTNNSNNSISKDFFEQQLHGDSFHPYVILYFICILKPADPGCQHGVQQEWGGARGDEQRASVRREE